MMRLMALSLLLILSVPGGLLAKPVLHYQGDQTLIKDTVWDGEILVDGILTVAAGVTLDIRPGSQIRFTRHDSNGDGIGEHEIFAQGTILALGTATAPIVFTSAETSPQRGDWGAVNMMVSESENRLEHCVVEYGYRGFHAHFSRASLKESLFRYNLRGAQFQESQVVINACRFLDNTNGVQFRDSKVTLEKVTIARSHWGVRCVYSEVNMTGCLIEDNLVNGVNLRDSKLMAQGNRITGNRRGLYLQRSEGIVSGNDLSANNEHGIFLEDSKVEVVANRLAENGRAGVRWLNSRGRLERNLIVNNGVYALINDGDNAIDARNNWWGSSEPSQIAAAIRDGVDRPGLGLVDARNALEQALPFVDPELSGIQPN